MIIAMKACVDRGDGSINLYEGPAGPETQKAIEAIDNWHEGVCNPNPDQEMIDDSWNEPDQSETDEELAWSILWWANSAAPRSEWEVDTGVHCEKFASYK